MGGKMKTLMTIFLLIFCIFCYQNDAKAVLGVADDVPSQDILFPIICEVDNRDGLNTRWAIAETLGGDVLYPGSPFVSVLRFSVFNREGTLKFDKDLGFTTYDVVTDDCQSLISQMPPSEKEDMKATIGGKEYYLGYGILENIEQQDNRYVGWVTLEDNEQGTMAQFNPFQAEDGIYNGEANDPVGTTGLFAEAMNPYYSVTAFELFPRYSIPNDHPETFNWWIVLTGADVADNLLISLIGLSL